MVSRGEPLKKLVEQTRRMVEHDEKSTRSRRNQRRPAELTNHQRRIEVLVSNLAYAVLNPPDSGRLAVDTRQGETGRSRYTNPALGPKPLRALLNTLLMTDLVDWGRATVMRGEKASIAPTEWFRRKVGEFGVTLSDFGRDPREELIILTMTHKSEYDFWSRTPQVKKKERVDYTDTGETTRLLQQVRGINDWLVNADIAFIDDGGPLVDPYDRAQRRMFTLKQGQEQRFDQSGRLFGGFWQQLRSDRRRNIRIEGEPVATLDFASMFPRLAYAEMKVKPPDGDLYAIPGLEGYRSGAKMAMNILLFDDDDSRKAWPTALGLGVGDDEAAAVGELPAVEFEARLPGGWTVVDTRAAFLRHHPALGGAFGRGLGHYLMHLESVILLGVLEELRRRGIAALGLHDGLLVATTRAQEARAVMEAVSLSIVGYPLPVTLKV